MYAYIKFNKIIKSLTAVIVIVSVGFSDDKTNNNLNKIDAFKHELGGKANHSALATSDLQEFNVQLDIANESKYKIVQVGGKGEFNSIYKSGDKQEFVMYSKTSTNYHIVANLCRDGSHTTESSRFLECDMKFKVDSLSYKLRVGARYDDDKILKGMSSHILIMPGFILSHLNIP